MDYDKPEQQGSGIAAADAKPALTDAEMRTKRFEVLHKTYMDRENAASHMNAMANSITPGKARQKHTHSRGSRG